MECILEAMLVYLLKFVEHLDSPFNLCHFIGQILSKSSLLCVVSPTLQTLVLHGCHCSEGPLFQNLKSVKNITGQ